MNSTKTLTLILYNGRGGAVIAGLGKEGTEKKKKQTENKNIITVEWKIENSNINVIFF